MSCVFIYSLRNIANIYDLFYNFIGYIIVFHVQDHDVIKKSYKIHLSNRYNSNKS